MLLSSFWKRRQSVSDLIAEDTGESFAKSDAIARCSLQSSSLIIMMKRIGPRTVPWGTPDNTGAGLDRAPLHETFETLLVRKLCSQVPTRPPILLSLSFLQRIK